jgi:hypothetical protein
MQGSNRAVQWMLIAVAATMLLPAALAAQGRGRGGNKGHVPKGHMPPSGLCRVWYDGVPPGHQPAPTRCDVAEADAYYNGGRVIYGAAAYRERRAHRPDRYCDEREYRRGECGYYPDRRPPRREYPVALPEMVWGVTIAHGGVVVEVHRWVTVSNARVRVFDYDRSGRPALVVWYDSRGNEVQRWFDDDRDGRADRVAVYEGGRVVRMVRRR